MFMTRQNLIAFTGYKVIHCQIEALTAFGMPFKLGVHGRPIVLTAEVQKYLGSTTIANAPEKFEPNWAALGV